MRAMLLAGVMVFGGMLSPVLAATVDFDDGVNGVAVGGAYSGLGVTFSNATFLNNFGLPGSSGSLGVGSSDENYVFGPDSPVSGSFASAVNAVSVRGIDVGQAGIELDVFGADGSLVASDRYFGSDVGVGEFHDLAVSGQGISSFRFYQPLTMSGANAFGDGVVFDNFSFTLSPVFVPEPGSLVVLGAGLFGAGLIRRRKTL